MENVTIIVDSVGRQIVGALNTDKTTKDSLALDTPAIVNIQADQNTGQLTVQFLPYVFSEFVANKDAVTWFFNKTSVVISDNLELDDRVIEQYKQIVQQASVPAPPAAQEEPEVIKLFDDE